MFGLGTEQWITLLQWPPLIVVVYAILSGRLVPRSMMRSIVDNQQEALNRQQEIVNTLNQTLPMILEYMRTSHMVISEIQSQARPPKEDPP